MHMRPNLDPTGNLFIFFGLLHLSCIHCIYLVFTPSGIFDFDLPTLSQMSFKRIYKLMRDSVTGYVLSYLCPAVLDGGRGERPAVLVEGTHPGRGQTRVQSRSPHGCRLPMPWEKPTDRRASGSHSHCPD